MSEVFADSFYFLALLNRDDEHHAAAEEAARNLRSRLATPHWVLMEVADALCAPSARERTFRFLRELPSRTNTIVIHDLDPWYERGLELFGDRDDKGWSLTDCISFCVMEERGIREALTGDHHFRQAGFITLLDPDAND